MPYTVEQRRPGRGEPARTRDDILRAALRIVDADGVAALTMRRLGNELGVSPMSIYHHLPGKAVAEPIYAALETAGASPRSAVEAVNTIVGFLRESLIAQVAVPPGGFDVGLDLLIAGIEAGLHSQSRPRERNGS